MPRYLRLRVPGGTYFFTVALADRRSGLLVREVAALRAAMRGVMADMPTRVDAMVILPDHIHAVWTLPPGDDDFSTRWKRIKADFSKAIRRADANPPPTTQNRAVSPSAPALRPGEAGVWQRRFWEHLIRDERDLAAHLAYCWGNPVRHGLVKRPVEWLHTSLHRDLRRGTAPPEWGA